MIDARKLVTILAADVAIVRGWQRRIKNASSHPPTLHKLSIFFVTLDRAAFENRGGTCRCYFVSYPWPLRWGWSLP